MENSNPGESQFSSAIAASLTGLTGGNGEATLTSHPLSSELQNSEYGTNPSPHTVFLSSPKAKASFPGLILILAITLLMRKVEAIRAIPRMSACVRWADLVMLCLACILLGTHLPRESPGKIYMYTFAVPTFLLFFLETFALPLPTLLNQNGSL